MVKSKITESYLMLVLVSLIWGTSYILIKKSLIELTPFQVASVRLFVASSCFLPICFITFDKQLWAKYLKSVLVVGFVGSAIPAILFALAQTKINSSLTGALSSMSPLFTLFLGILFFSIRSGFRKTAGILLGFTGALIAILSKGHSSQEVSSLLPGLLVLIASVCYALSTNTIGKNLRNIPSLVLSAHAFTLVFIPSLICLIISGVPSKLGSGQLLLVDLWPVVTLGLLSTVIASVLYFHLIKIAGSVFASTVSYLTPVVAIGLGIYDGESLTLYQITGTIFMLAGIFITRIET